MPTVRECPTCQAKMRVPDGLDGKVRCPKCGTTFSIGPAAVGPGTSGATQAVPDWFAGMVGQPQPSAPNPIMPQQSVQQQPAPQLQPRFDDYDPHEPWHSVFIRNLAFATAIFGCVTGVAVGLGYGFLFSHLNKTAGAVIGIGLALWIILVSLHAYAWTLLIIEFFSNVRGIRYRR
jgi:predicted Zn finger-like uncharacterized protein